MCDDSSIATGVKPTKIKCNALLSMQMQVVLYSSSSFGQAPQLNSCQHKSRPGPKVYPFTIQGCALPRLDAGRGGVKPISSCAIQNLQTSCSSWYMMYET